MEFLSTPSARRATQCGQLRHQLLQDFYPRPPRGGRRLAKIIGHALNAISIHALREEGDGLLYDYYTLADLFLSTPSARRATQFFFDRAKAVLNFYPRPPRGGRLNFKITVHFRRRFLSTPSARRATAYLGVNPTKERISIHALREEGDALHPYHVIHTDDFYPRPPRGGRRDTNQLYLAPVEISIHALREEGDGAGFQGIEATIQFLSTPSARRATLAGSRTTSSPIRFLSTPSARRATARRRVREGFRWISIHALREEGDAARSRP